MQKLAKIETAKVPATEAIAGVKTAKPENSNVIQLNTDDSGYRRLGLLVLIVVFGIFVTWAALAPLGSYAVATGKIVVQMKKQVVQHREGGVIQEIFVEDGDQVTKGQKLMVISPAEAQSEKGVVQEQLFSALGLEARLNAELEGHDAVKFPDELLFSKHPRVREIMDDERQQFKVRKAAANAEIAVMKQRIQQLKEQVRGTEKQIIAQRKLAASYTTEVKQLRGLFDRQLISKLRLDEAEREYLTVNTQIASLESQQSSFKVQIAEIQEQLVLQANNRSKESAAQLSEVRLKAADLRNRLAAASDRLNRTEIVAPESGTVVGLEYHTIGGVVAPGGKILEIVPRIEGFEVEAQLAVSDIDKVHVGLPTDIRFPAFSSSSFLKVTPGEVMDVSADTFLDQVSGMQYYRARVKILPEGLEELEAKSLELVQGMPAEVSIKTGDRTFLQYLVQPIGNMLNHAFNED